MTDWAPASSERIRAVSESPWADPDMPGRLDRNLTRLGGPAYGLVEAAPDCRIRFRHHNHSEI